MNTRWLLLTLFTAALWTAPGPARADVGVGDDAPEFKLVGSDGKTYTNEDFKGKQAVVIAWYPKAFTGG